MKRWCGAGLAASVFLLASCRFGSANRIVVGSKNFTEQFILGELLAQTIEARTGVAVERRVNLGGTLITHQALKSGQIDLYPEYTGTALTAILHLQPTQDAVEVFRRVQAGYRQWGLEWLEPLGFNNTFAIVVRGAEARRLQLRTVSDAAPYTPQWRAGFGYEFMERPDGYAGWAKTYGLRFGRVPRTMELGLLYRALKERQVDLVAGNSTDGVISMLDLAVLEDDRHYFPAYQAAVVVRSAALERHPQLGPILHRLSGRISEAEMRAMNQAVDSQKQDVRSVARQFLAAEGL